MKRLSPSNCSVVLFHEQNETLADLVDLLYSVFPTVVYKTRKPDIVHELKKQQYENTFTLLLIDAESCGISNRDDCPDLLLHVVHLIKEGILLDVVPIVCSSDDTPAYMVKCLQEGAADFVLKPICKDVIKTLFLNVTRYHIQKKQKKLDHIQQLTESTKSEKMVNHTNSGKVWEKFKERLKGVFFQEHWLSKLIADYYTPKPCVKRSSMASMLEDRKDYLKSHICSWDFLPLDLSNKDLVQVVFMILNDILTRYDELAPLRVPSDDLYHFIFDICNSYHNTNPYHNFRHAVDVLQANYYFLCHIGALDPMCPDAFVRFEHQQTDKEKAMNEKVANMLKPLDMFALLMASIGHDVGHPGVNNHFMVSTCTPLAILYNDKSVLESFHAMSFFHLLKSHCFSQLTDLRSNPEYASFRKIVVNSILATDMSLHDDYVSRIKDQADRLESDKVDFTDEMEKILLCGALIKCADISNCARPFESAKRWALILAEEFSEQGDLEKELGLPVLPINERGKIPLADFQLSFKRLIALKLFKAVSHVNSDMQFTVDYIYQNVDIWETSKKKKELYLNEKVVVSPNSISPQPSPQSKCNTSQRPRSGAQ